MVLICQMKPASSARIQPIIRLEVLLQTVQTLKMCYKHPLIFQWYLLVVEVCSKWRRVQRGFCHSTTPQWKNLQMLHLINKAKLILGLERAKITNCLKSTCIVIATKWFSILSQPHRPPFSLQVSLSIIKLEMKMAAMEENLVFHPCAALKWAANKRKNKEYKLFLARRPTVAWEPPSTSVRLIQIGKIPLGCHLRTQNLTFEERKRYIR